MALNLIRAVPVTFWTQYDGSNGADIFAATFAASPGCTFGEAAGKLTVDTSVMGQITANTGDWVMVQPGNLMVVTDAEFQANYAQL